MLGLLHCKTFTIGSLILNANYYQDFCTIILFKQFHGILTRNTSLLCEMEKNRIFEPVWTSERYNAYTLFSITDLIFKEVKETKLD